MLFPPLAAAFGEGPAALLYGVVPGQASSLADTTACFYIGLIIFSALVAFYHLFVFAPEREKSTLGFVLLTPMRSRSIIAGKMLGVLFSAAPTWLALVGWTGALTLMMLPSIGALGIVVWFEVSAMSVALAVGLGMCCLAVASLFPRAISSVGGGALGWLFSQVFVQCFFQFSRGMRRGAVRQMPVISREYGIWAILLTSWAVVTVVAALLAIWGVRRMRKGDIAFSASKQEN